MTSVKENCLFIGLKLEIYQNVFSFLAILFIVSFLFIVSIYYGLQRCGRPEAADILATNGPYKQKTIEGERNLNSAYEYTSRRLMKNLLVYPYVKLVFPSIFQRKDTLLY